MLTRNGHNMIQIGLNPTAEYTWTNIKGTKFKTNMGAVYDILGNNSSLFSVFVNGHQATERAPLVNGLRYMTMHIGVGEKKPTIDDYALGNEYANVIPNTFTSNTLLTNTDSSNIYVASATFVNTRSEAITVKEIGLLCSGPRENQANSQEIVLLAREVIDPVVINPGESYTFTFELK